MGPMTRLCTNDASDPIEEHGNQIHGHFEGGDVDLGNGHLFSNTVDGRNPANQLIW